MTIKAKPFLFQPKGHVDLKHCLLLNTRPGPHPATLSWIGSNPGEMPHHAVAPNTTDMLCTADCHIED